MEFQSINPYNGKVLASYNALSQLVLEQKINWAEEAFVGWKNVDIGKRTELLLCLATLLRKKTEQYAAMITAEMGKPITESRSEVLKCAWLCDYYAANASDFLKDEIIETDAKKSFVRHDPIGVVLGIMPWNFPFWQVFRFAVPAITAGNTVLLKHASNVFGCAQLIEQLFVEAGYPKDVFQNLIVHHSATEYILSHDAVRAVSLTGSEKAGSAVAALAGKFIKKSLLELGGNNAFIVWSDADIIETVRLALAARMMNAGQSCIAAKRFLLHDDIYNEFVAKFVDAVSKLKKGNPMEDSTEIGVLARVDLAASLQHQIVTTLKRGAELLYGGSKQNAYHEPTVLGNVRPGMPAFDEETFGPLATLTRFSTLTEGFELAATTRYGLGVTVCTQDVEKALSFSGEVADGAFFINELVKSDPRLPFGGTKKSGYGRELSKDGIMEFVNRKTVYVN